MPANWENETSAFRKRSDPRALRRIRRENERRKRKRLVKTAVYSVLLALAATAAVFAVFNLGKGNENLPVFASDTEKPSGDDSLQTGLSEQPQETDETMSSPLPTFVVAIEPELDTTLYDFVINNARIINPETLNDIQGMNIGILNGKISTITERAINGREQINVGGQVLCPGFIDIDSYEPNPFGVKYKLADGVTTNLLMHGGTAAAESWYKKYSVDPPLINYGASNFISMIRYAYEFDGGDVMESDEYIQKTCKLIEDNIKAGALGISMSPEYCPGLREKEMLAYCELAEKYGLAVYYHLRYSTTEGTNNSLKGIEEVIDLARKTGVSTHILHVTSTGSTNCAEEAFALIESALAEQLDLTCDLYPYNSWATYLGSNRFSGNWQKNFGLTYSDLQITNSSITLTEETFSDYQRQNSLVIANGAIPEDELRLALTKPYIFVASDSIMTEELEEHPRASGCYARLIGRYARDEKVITLMEAVAKATLLPAQRLEGASADMKKKGRIEIGADADIVIFDYDKIIDKSTNENTAVYSEGISYVFVNGVLAYKNGVFNEEAAGQPVRNYLVSPEILPETWEVTITFDGTGESLEAYDIFGSGKLFVSLREAADIIGTTYINLEDGRLRFDQAALSIGKTAYESYGAIGQLSHEPVIYRGEIYAAAADLGKLVDGVEVSE